MAPKKKEEEPIEFVTMTESKEFLDSIGVI